MPALSKKLLRSLPTLTEVVAAPPPETIPATTWDTADAEEALIERVLQRVELSLDVQVQSAIQAVLQEQMRDLAPRIRQRVDAAVRKAVSQALDSERKASGGGAF
jgi:hypothetical protein